MKRLAAAAALGTLVLTAQALVPPAAQAAETCHGLPATAVGTPGTDLRGTDGADVILTHGARQVFGAGGDDLICVTGSSRWVDAGPGNDRVDTTRTSRDVRTVLGEGNDEFVGGSGRDRVVAGTVTDMGDKVDTGIDDIATGDGGGRVYTGTGDLENSDDVSFGTAGPGEVNDAVFEGFQSFYYGYIDFGEGRARLFLRTLQPDAQSVSLYLQGGSFLDGGTQRLNWGGAAEVHLAYDQLAELRVQGSPADDHVVLHGSSLAHPMVRLGGGDDRLDVESCPRSGGDGVVDGGTGLDTVRLGGSAGCTDVDMALEGQAIVDEHVVAMLRRVDNLTARARRVSLTGNFRDNRLVSHACRTTIRGGEGADVLEAPGRTNCFVSTELSGGPGPDRLVGSPSTDLLVGGPNHDVAVGRRGTDTCRAEVEKGCER